MTGEICDQQHLTAIVLHIVDRDAHPRLGQAIHAVRNARFERRLAKRAVALIEPQLVRRRVIGHIDVCTPIAVEIRAHYAKPRPIRPVDPLSFRDVLELSVAQISKQSSRHWPVHLRCAVVRLARG